MSKLINRKKRKLSSTEKFPGNFVDNPLSMRWTLNPHSLSVDGKKSPPSQKDSMKTEERKQVILQQRHLKNTTSARWSKLTLRVIRSHADRMNSWDDVMKWLFTSVIFLPKTSNLSLIMRKTSDTHQLKDMLQNLTSTSRNCQGRQKTRQVWETVATKRNLRRYSN